MENNGYWKISNLVLVGDLEDSDNPHQYGDALTELIVKTHDRIQRDKVKGPQEIHKLIKKYPNVPAFKNYLTTYYNFKGDTKNAMAANRWLVKEHPNYLYGILNLCSEYLDTEQIVEIPTLLGGETFELQLLYPDRKIFHISEFASYTKVVATYFIATNNMEAAKSRIDLLTDIFDNQHPLVKDINQIYEQALLRDSIKEYIPALEQRYLILETEHFNIPLPSQSKIAPSFSNGLIELLYTQGIEIHKDVLHTILKLPREQLINDLEKIVLDSAQRFQYFDNNYLEEIDHHFLLHAIALLTELNAKEKFPLILKTLSYGDDFVEFYFGDYHFEIVWMFFYRIYQDDPNQLKNYIIDPQYNEKTKLPLIQALHQIAWHQPSRKEEIIQYYEVIINTFLENIANPRIADEEFIDHIVSDMCDLDMINLLPKIKILDTLDLMGGIMFSNFEEIEEIMTDEADPFAKRIYFDNIADLYQYIISNWNETITEQEEDLFEKEFQKNFEKRILKEDQPTLNNNDLKDLGSPLAKNISSTKVGRNEPCPCGSGKKYKKCCL